MNDETVVNPEVEETPDVPSDAAQEQEETEQESVSFSDVLSSMENVEDEGQDSPPEADEDDEPADEEDKEEESEPTTTEPEEPEEKLFTTERVNEIVSKRVNETKVKTEEKMKAQYAPDSAIATVARSLYEGKTDQEIMDAMLEAQAKEAGIDENTVKFLQKKGLIKAPDLPSPPEPDEQPQDNQNIEAVRDRIISEAEALSKGDSKFKLLDFLETIQKSENPKIKSLEQSIMNGMSLTDAYDLYKIRQSSAAAEAQKKANAAAEPAAPKRRNSGNKSPFSMANATDEQLDELKMRARRGERIVPD